MVVGKVDGQILFGAKSEKPKILFGARREKPKILFGAKWQLRTILFGSQRVRVTHSKQLNTFKLKLFLLIILKLLAASANDFDEFILEELISKVMLSSLMTCLFSCR